MPLTYILTVSLTCRCSY